MHRPVLTPGDRVGLARAIADAALLRGQFTLRSGRTSRYYLDKYLFTTEPAILAAVAAMMGERLPRFETDRPIARLAGTELGGIPLVTAASLGTGIPCLLVRGAAKAYGTSKRIEGRFHRGERTVFIEDVVTTGGASIEAITALREAELDVVGMIATIDRQEGGREAVEALGVPFEALFTKDDLGIEE